ncbi:MAG: hypothetical protein R2764_03875 [Bacteroidales bacterium]
MKDKRFLFVLLSLIVIFNRSKKSDEETNNDNPATVNLGEVGNRWKVKIDNSFDLNAEIISKEGDVRTIEVSYAKLVTKAVKFGFAGNEVVDYAYSKGDLSKPFTMVKFDAKVGDIYSTEINGIYHSREVIEKNTYHIPALNKDLETIGVYEWIPEEIPSTFFGFTIREIIWYWHPTYGLVCVDVYTEEGDYIEVVFVNIEL